MFQYATGVHGPQHRHHPSAAAHMQTVPQACCHSHRCKPFANATCLLPTGTLMVPVFVLEELIKQRLKSIIGTHISRNTVRVAIAC